MKILIAIPHHNKKDYSILKAFHAAEAIVKYAKDIAEFEIVCRIDTEPFASGDNVKKQREFFRNMCLMNNFDYVFFLGADIVPPPNTIVEMIDAIKEKTQDIMISGVYWLKPGDKKEHEHAVAWINGMDDQKRRIEVFSNSKGMIRVDGAGMDCMLIPQKILRKISFMEWGNKDDDYPFCDRARKMGYEIYVLPQVQCKHFSDSFTYSENAQKNN